MRSDLALRVARDAIQDNSEIANDHVKTAFFPDFSTQRLMEGLAQLNPTAGDAPEALRRRVTALDQQNAFAIGDDGADGDDDAGCGVRGVRC